MTEVMGSNIPEAQLAQSPPRGRAPSGRSHMGALAPPPSPRPRVTGALRREDALPEPRDLLLDLGERDEHRAA